jgi:hypothetical protein
MKMAPMALKVLNQAGHPTLAGTALAPLHLPRAGISAGIPIDWAVIYS